MAVSPFEKVPQELVVGFRCGLTLDNEPGEARFAGILRPQSGEVKREGGREGEEGEEGEFGEFAGFAC
jgi:hypothetical protein